MTTITTTTYELKNVKIAEWASQETTCFSATLYINGKRIGTCDNEGWGGCNNYDFDTSIITDNAAEWLWNDYVTMCQQHGFEQKPRDEFHADPDSLISALIDKHYIVKDVKAFATRLKKKYGEQGATLRFYIVGDRIVSCVADSDRERELLRDNPDATIAPPTATLSI